MIRVDAHEDLAWNMLTFGRDYTRSVAETRSAERGSATPRHNGDTLLGWPQWVQGRMGVVFATLFAAPVRRREGDWDVLCYADPQEANRLYRRQVDTYHRLADQHPDKFRLIRRPQDLQQVEAAWDSFPADGELSAAPAVGLVLLMEGADCVLDPAELPEWFKAGVRILGPAWAGTRYAGGTGDPGRFTREGHALLEAMAEMGMALDLSHLSEEAAREGLDRYPGVVLATHSNPRALVWEPRAPERHLSDEVIRGLAERQGVIGVVLYNRFLRSEWTPDQGRRAVPLETVADHIDHICQVTGSSNHVGIGSDFDGGFGLQEAPQGLDSIADLGFIGSALQQRGYDQAEIEAILGGNWLGLLRRILQGTG
jgi:membrane dipeptidase